MIGRKLSEETRLKMSLSHRDKTPSSWGAGFKKGNIPWNKGYLKERPINLIDKVYFAALVDGEGSIFITNNTNASVKYKKVCVVISMRADKAKPLPEGQRIWGGALNERQPRKSNHNVVLSWTLGQKNAENLLNDIKPFLRIKHKQAEIALKYRWMQTKKKQFDNKITDDDWKIREELHHELKRLNQ